MIKLPWMPKKAVEKSVYSTSLKMENNRIITLKTRKKDRTVSIKKIDNKYELTEDGFKKAVYRVNDEKTLKKSLKDLIEMEFPRSHEILVTNQEVSK